MSDHRLSNNSGGLRRVPPHVTLFAKVIRGSVDRANIYLSVIDGAAFGSEEEELADLCAAPTGPSPLAQHAPHAHPRIFTITY